MDDSYIDAKGEDSPLDMNDEFGAEIDESLEPRGSSSPMEQESGIPLHLPTPNPLANAPSISDFPAMAPMDSSSSLIMNLSREGSQTALLCSTMDDGPPLKKLKLETEDLAVVGIRGEDPSSGAGNNSTRSKGSLNKKQRGNPSDAAATSSASTTTSVKRGGSSAHVSSASATSMSEAVSEASMESHGDSAASGPLSPKLSAAHAEENPPSGGHNKQSAPQHASSSDDGPMPIKATKMEHLRRKYCPELEYMLKEFRKLERQLLGATGAAIKETEGSRLRREKLHSFILHLEDSIRQIELGCQLEAEGKTTVMVGVTVGEGSTSAAAMAAGKTGEESKQQIADSSALASVTQEKEEEENVQKLEEHILANLLPVKQRLTRQLAAQKGASRNPVGMPVAPRGMLQASADKGKGTFAAAAEQRRKQLEAAEAESLESTQFGRPLGGGASSLTQKLHGSTLGSKSRLHGHGVGSSTPTEGASSADGEEKPKILYAGMAIGSTQKQSGMSAASTAHKVAFETAALLPPPSPETDPSGPPDASHIPTIVPDAKTMAARHAAAARAAGLTTKPGGAPLPAKPTSAEKKRKDASALSENERKKLLQKKKQKRKKQRQDAKTRERERHLQISRQQQGGSTKGQGKRGKGAAKGQGKKKAGPRPVEYICALCGETYNSTCEGNPWWSLTSHDCPKCHKTQIPRIDISARANQIEYHPALLAHAEEGNVGSSGGSSSVMKIDPAHLQPNPVTRKSTNGADSDSDMSDMSLTCLSEDSEPNSDGDSPSGLSLAAQAENEEFGFEYTGPEFSDDESARLLVLIAHASTCPGRHRQPGQRDVCRSVKYLMLHVRDCPGTTSTYDVCPFPWCRKMKHLLHHLVSCTDPKECAICSPTDLSPNLRLLIGLNDHRRKRLQERRARAMAAAAAAARAASSSNLRSRAASAGARGPKKGPTPKMPPYPLGAPKAVPGGGSETAHKQGTSTPNQPSQPAAAAAAAAKGAGAGVTSATTSGQKITPTPPPVTAATALIKRAPSNSSSSAIEAKVPRGSSAEDVPTAKTIAAAQDTVDSVLTIDVGPTADPGGAASKPDGEQDEEESKVTLDEKTLATSCSEEAGKKTETVRVSY